MSTASATEPNESRIIAGFDRLTLPDQVEPATPGEPAWPTAEPGPDPAPASDPVVQLAPPVPTGSAKSADPDQSVGYDIDTDVLAERAILGSVLHAPAALTDLRTFLLPRDFATATNRAVYEALLSLHRAGALIDVAALSTEAQQLEAANENYVKLFAALRAVSPVDGRADVTDIRGVIGAITAAAPATALPYSGVYDPGAQMRIGRMVLEDSIRRQLGRLRVRMTHTVPLLAANHGVDRGERATAALIGSLEATTMQVDALAQRFADAVRRSSPADATHTEQAVAPAPSAQRRVPDRLRAIAHPLQNRAERHLIHLALHTGRMDQVPDALLNLTPDDFTDTRHANLWHTIKDLQQQGLPVNYVSVDRANRATAAHLPTLPQRTLIAMAEPPEVRPARIVRSLRTVVSNALARATAASQQTINTMTASSAPVASLLQGTREGLTAITDRARTTLTNQQAINDHVSPRR